MVAILNFKAIQISHFSHSITTNNNNNNVISVIHLLQFKIINVSKASAQMLGTKVEITLPKAEPGNWTTLDFPRTVTENAMTDDKLKAAEVAESVARSTPTDNNDSDVDLNDIEQVRGVKITDA